MKRKTRGEKLVNQFEEWVREHEMLGARDPAEHREIEITYALARAELITYIQLLESLYERPAPKKSSVLLTT